MMDQTAKPDVCIIGAGVAGATMAAYLGKQGKKVCIIEKNWEEQDRIVGELLQPGGVNKLEEMGLGFLIENLDAQPVTGYALFLNNENFEIPYPVKEHKEPVKGYGFRNGKFVQKVRDYIRSLPGVTAINGTVNHIIDGTDRILGVKYTLNETGEEKELYAPLTIVCEGPFSNFREQLSTPHKKVSGYFLGMVLKNCQLPYPGHGHVVIAEPSPFLLYPITSTETRILIDFPGATPPKKSPELKHHLLHVIGPQVPESARPSYTEAVEEGRYKVMPNHHLPASPVFKPGAVLIGDSLNMRHPLTGGGMTVAFTDIHNLGSLLGSIDDFADEASVNNAIREFYATRHHETATINILADALYKVMSSPDLKDACYEYLKRGGKYSAEPISILSAISRDQKLLQNHFFAVALYGAKKLMAPFPSPQKIGRSYRMVKDAVHIIDPLLMNEHPDWKTRSAIKASKVIF